MSKLRQPKLPSTSGVTRRERAARWLESSPTKKLLVAGAAMFAFALSLTNATWTAYKEYEQAKLKVWIEIASRTSYPLWTNVSLEKVFGSSLPDARGDRQTGPRVEMPYYPVVLALHNPTDKKSTLSHCVLKIRFYAREGEYESSGYLTEKSLTSLTLDETPITIIDSGATIRVEWLFFFLPDPTFQQLLADKGTQAVLFKVVCRDEANRQVISGGL
jgi:hypothetical protein